jgi:hypothetical protein
LPGIGIAVELFQISCVTCRARLRVRDGRFIGQILACPKCNSMVEITPPAGWAPPSDMAATLPLTAAAALAASPAALSPIEHATAAAIPASKSLGALPQLLHSTVVWWSTAGIVMLAAAGLGATIALHGSGESTPSAQPTITTAAPAPSDPQRTSGVCQGLVAAMDEQSKLNLPADVETEKIAEDVANPDQLAGGEKAPAATTNQTAISGPQNESAKDTQPSNTNSSPADPPRTLKLEPVPIDSTATSASAIGESLASSTPQYSASQSHMESSNVDSQNITAANLRPIEAPHPLLRFGPSTQDAARRTNLADQVAMPIKSFDMADAPLSRVLETLANLAAAPITVDPAVLSTAGIAPDTKVTVHAHDTTVGKLIGTVLREHNLACKLSDSQLVVELRSGQKN